MIVLLALTGIVLIGVLVASLGGGAAAAVQRDQQTALAMAKARQALIARAAGDDNRPGSLPCPDNNNDGDVSIVDDWSGSQCAAYVGRLPWKYLELPDLRDGNGDRLWYVLSTNFRDNPLGGPLNSETTGNLDVTGPVSGNDVVAIIISPGEVLAGQDRVGGTLLRGNYLDGTNADPDTDVNFDSTPSASLNDRLTLITRDDLFQVVERRVAREARTCLETVAVGGRFPWAAPMSDTTTFADDVNTLVGRVPATLTNTQTSLQLALADPLLTVSWPVSDFGVQCFGLGTWWDDWRAMLLYQVAAEHAPDSAGGPCGTGCLSVNGTANLPAVVISSGRALANPDQSARPSNPDDVVNYLETAGAVNNADGPASRVYVRAATTFVAAPAFNDRVECVGSAAC